MTQTSQSPLMKLGGPQPYWMIACTISCIVCSIVMIWGVYVMRSDMQTMERMMTPMSGDVSSTQSLSPDEKALQEHCQAMPEMKGCEKYQVVSMSSMTHDMGSMTMDDMSKMLEGKTGDELDRAFIEGMIPHHQAAVDMARALTGAKHPELRAMGEEIISAQTREIEQMRTWQREWGYTK